MSHIISPHLDDAVLSLGQYMASRPTRVVTVFAGSPGNRVALSDYDKACGFPSSALAVAHRRMEDQRACRRLSASHVHLDYLDGQYDLPTSDGLIADALCAWVGREEWHTFVPLGLGHPDHRQVARCARAACPEGGELLLYEELPYRVLWPEQVVEALEEVRAEGFTIDELPWPLPQGEREAKAEALGLYRSQFPDGPVDPCFYVPERVWRVTR